MSEPALGSLGVACALFIVGGCGFLLRTRFLVQLVCLELMLHGGNLALSAARYISGALDSRGPFWLGSLALQVLQLLVALAIVVAIVRCRASDASDSANLMRH